jgi:transposase
MARPYSQDLRDRVVAAGGRGPTCRAAAVLFGASAVKWSQRWRATGSAAGRPTAAAVDGRAEMAAGAARREARSDLAGGDG